MHDPLTGLRVIRADILKSWSVKSDVFDIEVELNREVERNGFKIAEILIKYRQRVGEKKLKVRDGVTILKNTFGNNPIVVLIYLFSCIFYFVP